MTFTAAELPSGLRGVRISYGDGTERTLGDAETLDDVPAEAWRGAITCAPLAEDVVRRRYDLTGGSGVGTTFDETPRGTTVIATVTDPSRSDSMRSATAGSRGQADRWSVRVVVAVTGVVSAHSTCIDEESRAPAG